MSPSAVRDDGAMEDSMRVILFGATGMIGSGVLLECLADARIEAIVSVVRQPSGVADPKLRELIHDDFLDYVPICAEFAGADACFFCLGVSSAGMSEADYRRVTYEFTLAAAKEIIAESPESTFCYVSGAGTDGTGRGRVMWARVKGQTEQALLAMPFKSAYMFRPGYIQPLKGVRSKTALYQLVYTVVSPLYPILRTFMPSYVTTTVNLGRAMIEAAYSGCSQHVLETPDINALAQRWSPGHAGT
jgi:uncharacterized protein YbjT (DUF2867 family)